MMHPLQMWPVIGYFTFLAFAGPGYLPIIGPVPLRLQAPATNRTAVLPPLLLRDPEPTNAPPTAPAISKETVEVSTNSPPPAKPLLSVATATNLPPPAASLQGLFSTGSLGGISDINNTMVTPQMLVPFFQPKMGSNSVPVSIIMTNLSFSPPAPYTPPPSTATYDSPAAKPTP
jgi:hypothetical protein